MAYLGGGPNLGSFHLPAPWHLKPQNALLCRYHIQLKYGDRSWEVAKRFSEFDSLLQSLATNRFGGLPKLPAKTLLGSPMDQAAIDARKEQPGAECHRIVMFLSASRAFDALNTAEVADLAARPASEAPHTWNLLVVHIMSTAVSKPHRPDTRTCQKPREFPSL